ncbi:unnamed protein product, partial [Prunus brigantina]
PSQLYHCPCFKRKRPCFFSVSLRVLLVSLFQISVQIFSFHLLLLIFLLNFFCFSHNLLFLFSSCSSSSIFTFLYSVFFLLCSHGNRFSSTQREEKHKLSSKAGPHQASDL